MHNANVHAFRDALARIPGMNGMAVADALISIKRDSASLKRDAGDAMEMS